MEQDANVAAQLRLLADGVERGDVVLAAPVVWKTGRETLTLAPNRAVPCGYTVGLVVDWRA